MPTITLRPNGVGSEANLSIYAPNTGEDNWEDVDEAVADDLTTCLRTKGTDPDYPTFKRDLYACENHSQNCEGTINSVTIHWRIRGGGQTTYSRSALKTGGTIYNGAEKSQSDGATWHDWSQEYTTNPNTESAWTWSEVDAMETGISAATADESAGSCYPTQVYAVVDYDACTYPETATTAIGLVASASRVATYTRSASDEIGLIATASRALAYARTATKAIGLIPTATRVIAYVRSATDQIGLVAAASRVMAYARSATDQIGLVASASRALTIARTATTVAIGLVATASRVVAYARMATDQIGLVARADYAKHLWKKIQTSAGRTFSTHTGKSVSTHAGRDMEE